jgi:transcriptional regulator with XRE-family HTH domain
LIEILMPKKKSGTHEILTLAHKIKDARAEKHLSLAALGDLIGLSDQQVTRIEKAKSEVSPIILARIAKATGKNIEWFLEHVQTVEDRANILWQKHGLAKKLAGTKTADFRAKRKILEAMGLWEE